MTTCKWKPRVKNEFFKMQWIQWKLSMQHFQQPQNSPKPSKTWNGLAVYNAEPMVAHNSLNGSECICWGLLARGLSDSLFSWNPWQWFPDGKFILENLKEVIQRSEHQFHRKPKCTWFYGRLQQRNYCISVNYGAIIQLWFNSRCAINAAKLYPVAKI